MRRILLVMSVALVMAAVLVASAMPALAAPPPFKPGAYTCVTYDPFTGQYQVANNVPQGQTATYVAAGWYCYSNQQLR